MTEPYTAEELQRVASQVEDAVREAGGYGSGPDLARLAATLREYERVVEEREALKDLIKARYSNMTLPAGYNVLDFLILWHTQEKTARQKAEAEVAALRADKETLHKRLALAGMDVGVVVHQNGAVGVLCNDLWSFATADVEPIPDSELDCCIEVATQFGEDGLTAWACWRRQQEPMRYNGASPADSDQYKAAMAWLSARAAGEG